MFALLLSLALAVAIALVIAIHDLGVVLRVPLRRTFVGPLGRYIRARRISWLYPFAFWAMPVAGAGVSSFVPEVWAAALLTSLKKSQVVARLANRNYEGDIAQAGDTVHITSISRPTVATYVPNVTVIAPEVLTTADRVLAIDQAKYFAFEVDDVDLRQLRGNIIDEAMREAAYALSDVADQFLIQLAGTNAGGSLVAAANQIADTAVTTGDLAYTQLTKLGQKLNEANVALQNRFVIIPPWYLQLLLDTNKIAFNPMLAGSAAIGTAALIDGYVNRLAGLDVYVSNNVQQAAGDGDDSIIVAGTPDAWSYAEQISKTEAYRPPTTFADAIKGLHLYGAKVTRPDGLATLIASKA